jgi:ferritin
MLEAKMRDALNKQINAELYSSYLYLSMAAWFESLSLRGFAHWMRVQAKEEEGHAMKFFDYVIERGGKIDLKAIEAPPKSWQNPLAAFKAVAAHEAKVTGLINTLADQAQDLHDHATGTTLHWFISEQVEEEANAAEIVAKLEMIGASSGGLFALDHQLAKRGE